MKTVKFVVIALIALALLTGSVTAGLWLFPQDQAVRLLWNFATGLASGFFIIGPLMTEWKP